MNQEKTDMRKLARIAAHAVLWLLTLWYCVAAIVAIYHQYEALRHAEVTRYVYVTNTPIHSSEYGETVITGYRTVPVTELTEEQIEEEMYYDSLEMLAACVEAEAANQGLEGKRLVVDVILNRVDSSEFPNSITEVIMQPYHFSSYWDGRMETTVPTDETFEAVRLELEHRSNTEILYFTAGEWPAYGTRWRKVGDHYFAKE